MRRIAIPAALGCLLAFTLAATADANAQDRKPGLYEITVTTTTVSPAPPTSTPAARTRQVCLTQEMIDKYGAMIPDRLTRICQVSNSVKKPGGMSADLVCSGPITGKGTLEVNWTDSEHATGNIHFSGTMQPGDAPIKIEWAAVTKSAYKSPDCGDLKPATPEP
jgi:Protein of unknown function (DUF3617)